MLPANNPALRRDTNEPRVQELPDPEPGASGQVVKKDGLTRLVEMQMEEINFLSKKIELWTQYRDDYKKLKQLIDRMQDKVKHPHRVPIAGSKLAFVDGHIIHTNEFHVLLGDNYFALRSARQSNQIVDRRLEDIKQKLKAAEDAKKKTQGWLEASEERIKDKEEFVEIIETM